MGASDFRIKAGRMFNSKINDFGVFLDVRSIAKDKIITYKELLTNPSIANLLYVVRSICLWLYNRRTFMAYCLALFFFI